MTISTSLIKDDTMTAVRILLESAEFARAISGPKHHL